MELEDRRSFGKSCLRTLIVHVVGSIQKRFAQPFTHRVSEQLRLEATLFLVGELLVVEIPYEQPGTDIQVIDEKLGLACSASPDLASGTRRQQRADELAKQHTLRLVFPRTIQHTHVKEGAISINNELPTTRLLAPRRQAQSTVQP